MKFSEKLIKLRKENKLSQEQLANMLDVSRQSVSKWESGQTYPEMDKLLSLCKIFKCSLDDLTNDEISKEDMSINQNKKNSFINVLYEVLEFINKSISMLKAMSFKEILKMIFVFLLLGIFLLILRIPFEFIIDACWNLLWNLDLPNNFIYTIYNIWSCLINMIYLIFIIIIIIYIYKVRYLDKFEETEEEIKLHIKSKKEEPEETEANKKESKIIEKVIIKKEDSKGFTLLNALGTIMKYIIKFIVICISLPFVCTLAIFAFFLIIDILLIFKGIIFVGVLLGLIFALLFNYMLIEIMFKFIFNMSINLKKIFVIFVISVIGIGASIGIFTLEVTSIKLNDELPPEIKSETITKEILMDEDSYILYDDYDIICYNNDTCNYYATDIYNIIKEYDESYTDKVKFELTYNQDFTKVEITEDNGKIDINRYYVANYNTIIKLFNLVIDNLKKKELYNLNSYELSKVNIVITTSKENHEKLDKKTQEKAEKIYQQELQDIHDSYTSQIYNLEAQIDELNNQIIELQNNYDELEEEKNNQIEDLKYKLEEKEEELQDYKNRISELIDE